MQVPCVGLYRVWLLRARPLASDFVGALLRPDAVAAIAAESPSTSTGDATPAATGTTGGCSGAVSSEVVPAPTLQWGGRTFAWGEVRRALEEFDALPAVAEEVHTTANMQEMLPSARARGGEGGRR